MARARLSDSALAGVESSWWVTTPSFLPNMGSGISTGSGPSSPAIRSGRWSTCLVPSRRATGAKGMSCADCGHGEALHDGNGCHGAPDPGGACACQEFLSDEREAVGAPFVDA
jgi:hypothetical protein